MKRNLTLVIALFLTLLVWGQNIMTGRVVDAETGEALPYVTIRFDGGGTLSNQDGDFELSVAGDKQVVITCIGYNKLEMQADKMPSVIRLKPYSTALNEVVVVAKNYKILSDVIDNLKKDAKHGKKIARKYFFRTVIEESAGSYIAEAFLKAYSAVNVHSATITSGLQGGDLYGNEGMLNLNSSNIHKLIEVGPQTTGSLLWQDVIKPLSSIADVKAFYDTHTLFMHGENGKALYQMVFSMKKNTPKCHITGTAFIDAETNRLLRFDGQVHNLMVSGTLFPKFTTMNFHIDYDYNQGGACVANLSVDGENDQMLYHVLLHSMGDSAKAGKKKKDDINIVTALMNAGYDARLWKDYDVVKRTRKEEQALYGESQSSSEKTDSSSIDIKYTDNDSLRNSWQSLWKTSQRYAQEKVFVHMDNTSYQLGDTIWFAAYVRDTNTKVPSRQSGLLYVELLNQDGYLIERKQIKLARGCGNGYFALDEQAQYSGFYELRAYTRWQLNFGTAEKEHTSSQTAFFINSQKEQAFFRDYDKLYSRVFPVYDRPDTVGGFNRVITPRPQMYRHKQPAKRSLRLTLHPEGGYMVAGMESTIAFEASWSDGEAANGTLYVGNDSVSTIHRGRGCFVLTPQSVQQQKVSFRAKDGQVAEAMLPAPEASGVILHAKENEGGWNITVHTTGDLKPQDYGMTIMNEGKISYFRQLKEQTSMFRIPASSLRPGVNQATVFDIHGNVLADRLFFVWKENMEQPTMKIEGKCDGYKPYDPIQLNIKSTQPLDSIAIADHGFSLAIRDAERTDRTYDNSNIMTEMLLSSEIRGYVPDPAWFFQQNDSTHHRALDLLLMVQGWRRFSFDRMARKEPLHQLQPREKVPMIVGEVYGLPAEDMMAKQKSDIRWVLHQETVDMNSMEHTHSYQALFGDARFAINMPTGNSNYVTFLEVLEKQEDKDLKPAQDRSADEISGRVVKKSKGKSKKQKTDLQIRLDVPYPRYVHPYSYYQQRLIEDSIQMNKAAFKGFKDCYPNQIVSRTEVSNLLYDQGILLTDPMQGIAVIELNDFEPELTMRYGVNRFRRNYENMQGIPYDSLYAAKYLKSYPASFEMGDDELDEYKGIGSIEKYVLYTDRDRRSDSEGPVTISQYPYRDGFKRSESDTRCVASKGFDKTIQCYTPDYSLYSMPADHKDYRRTLFWYPNLHLDEKGEAHLTIFNNSRTTQLSVEAEGQASDGTLLWGDSSN